MDDLTTLDHIFAELRYYEDRARSEEETRETRLGTLVAFSGAVLGLLAASASSADLPVVGIVFVCLAVSMFVLAILVATQFLTRLPLAANRFGGPLEKVKEVDREEFEFYEDESFQAADRSDLQRRVLPIMRSAIGSRRRNVARKEKYLHDTVRLVAGGILAAAVYAAILVI